MVTGEEKQQQKNISGGRGLLPALALALPVKGGMAWLDSSPAREAAVHITFPSSSIHEAGVPVFLSSGFLSALP